MAEGTRVTGFGGDLRRSLGCSCWLSGCCRCCCSACRCCRRACFAETLGLAGESIGPKTCSASGTPGLSTFDHPLQHAVVILGPKVHCVES